jgi:amino acid adenylation domain-containing protein
MSNNSKEFDSLSEKKKIILERLLREKKEEKEKQTTDIGTIQRRKQEGPVPLSFAQQRMWFLEQLEPGSHAYNIPSAMRITGKLDIPALEQGLNTIIKRHESMRTIFEEADGIPTQVIKPHLEIKMDYMDLRNITEEEKESRVKEFATEDNRKPYNLSKGPLIRASLLQLYNEEHILILNMHHLISDGWSMRVLMQEIGAVYCGILDGKNVSLPELNIQYADYASWQRNSMQGEYLKQQLEVWKKQLEGCNFVLEVPTDHPRPPVQSFKGSRHYIELPENLVKTLNDMCRQKGVTMFMMLLAAFKVLLLRYTGQGDMVVGTPVAGRSRTELEGLIGFFVNMLVLRTDLSDNPSFSELLHRVRKMNLEAIANQDVPFENLVEELQPQRDLSRNPLFQVAFGYQSETIPPVEFKGLSFESIEVDSSTARFDIEFQTWKSGSGISGYLEYSTDLYSKDTIKRMADYYKTILEGIAANPDRPVMSIPLMPEEEKRKILTEWNNTKADFPEGKCINQMFEEQVDKTPDAVAVIFDGTQLTYSELNEKANRLAGYLRKAGVGPGVPVGICMERSLEMVVGIYGIVKAGGAYLPIDPEYPKGRREFMINDAQVRILLTQEKIVGELPENDAELLCLDTHWERLTGESVENTSPNLCPEDPVYIIYTSGSTGKPKGVVNIHKGLVNRLNWMQKVYSLGAHDRVMQKTPFSFDVSVWEFFWPLLNGACLVVAKPGGHRDSDYLISLINEMKITTIHFVPSMLRLLLENDRAGTCRSLRRVICSGEALPYSLQEKFFAALEQTELHNLYGPTEASIDVTSWECRKNYGRRIVPIGRPIDNTSIYILDSNLEPLPVGIPGEIHIGGIGLAKGYYKRPELTAEKFIPDPFSKVQNENALSAVNPSLMYKTGDLARYLPDGNIEFLGRIDHQVKLRGLRIELEEIEFAVASYSGIQEAVVIVREDNPGDMRLVAYMTEDKENPVNIRQLTQFLKGQAS